uniref:Recep_L_domain domain-containing protein n=2 Tax=Caenorhabditis tropicalis TaxID=1561998 RepID=A0A1I7T7N1_9PELO
MIILEEYRMRFGFNEELLELGLTNLSSTSCNIIVYNNKVMKKLNLPSLKMMTPPDLSLLENVDFRNRTYINISPESPDFCITTDEMRTLMSFETNYIEKIYGKYCEPTISETVCRTPAIGCLEVIGNVEINSEFQLDSMRNVERIYGSLVITGTNITDFSFLEHLEFVVTLEQKLAITIENNPNLNDVRFPKLKVFGSNSNSFLM